MPFVVAQTVDLVSGTSRCFKDCETVYSVTAERDMSLDENTFWFEFRDANNLEPRHADSVNQLDWHSVEYGYPRIEEYPFYTVDDIECAMVDGEEECWDSEYHYETRTRTVYDWKPLPASINLKEGEKTYLRITGAKQKDAIVDNVLVLQRKTWWGGTEYHRYLEYYWWGSWQLDHHLIAYYSMDNSTADDVWDDQGSYDLYRVSNNPTPTTNGKIRNGTYVNDSSSVYFGTECFASTGDVFDIADGSTCGWFNRTSYNKNGLWYWGTAESDFYIANMGTSLAGGAKIGGVNRNPTIPSTNYSLQHNYFICLSWNTTTTSDVVALYYGNETTWFGKANSVVGNFGAIVDDGYNFTIGARATGGCVAGFVGVLDEISVYDVDHSQGGTTDDFFEALHNMTAGYAYGCNPTISPACNGTAPAPTAAGINITSTFDDNVNETTAHNFSFNFSFNHGIQNITNCNLTYNGYFHNQDSATYGVTTGINWTMFDFDNIRAPLAAVNTTDFTLNLTYFVQYANGTNMINYSDNESQTVKWAFYPYNITRNAANITETENTTIRFASINETDNLTGVTINYLLNYDGVTGVPIYDFTGYNGRTTGVESNFSSGLMSAAYVTNKTINISAIVNVSFNGSTYQRTTTFGNTTQSLNKMIVHDCSSTPAFQQNITHYYDIRDAVTLALLGTADLVGTYTIWNNTKSLNRTYIVSHTNDAQPELCILPNFGSLMSDFKVEYGADGYNPNTQVFLNSRMKYGTSFYNLTLLNTTGTTNVTMNVLDENDDPVENVLINIELWNGTHYIFVASDYTDFQGQKQFALDLNDDYRINLTIGGVLQQTLAGQPASFGPFQILTTSLTFNILLGQSASLQPLIDIYGMPHNLTFDNTTNIFTLQYWDDANATTKVCLDILHQTLNSSTKYGPNCSTNNWDELNLSIGTTNGSFLARGIGTSNVDSRDYLFATLSLMRPSSTIFGLEGVVWAIIVIGTMSAIGMTVTGGNPVGLVVGAILGLAVCSQIFFNLISISLATFMIIVFTGGVIIYLVKT